MNTKIFNKVIGSFMLSAMYFGEISGQVYANDNLRAIANTFSNVNPYVEQAKKYAQNFLDGWNDLKLAFKEEKLEAIGKLNELGFQEHNLITNIRLFRNDKDAQKGRFYFNLLLFDEAFEELDKSVEKYKDVNYFISRPELLRQIKKEILNTMMVNDKLTLSYFNNIDNLSEYPLEFFAWLKIGLLFNDLSIQCRSFNIGIYRKDPDCPLQRIECSTSIVI